MVAIVFILLLQLSITAKYSTSTRHFFLQLPTSYSLLQ